MPYVLNNVTDMNMQEDQLKGFLDLDGTSLPSSGIFSDPDLGDSMKFQLWNGMEWIWLNEGNRYPMNSKIFAMLGNGSLMIEPEENHYCEENLQFRAVDRMGAKAEHSVRLQIRPINDPPELHPVHEWTFHTQPKGIKGTIITVLEETLLDMTITAEDPIEPWDRENFTFSSNASDDNCPFFDVDQASGRVSFTPNNDDVGIYYLTITVDDGNDHNQYDDVNIKLVIENVNDPPEITTADLLECWEDQLYIVEYHARDDDPGDPDLTWTLDTDAGFLTMDRNTGLLQGTPDNDDVGIYDLIITVEDGSGATDMIHFQLTVHNVNDPPVPYEEYMVYHIDEDTGLFLSLFDRFHDDDDMILSYGIDQGRNISTRIVEDQAYFSPERDWSGEETFNITATDGIDTAFMIFRLIYEPVDDSPTGVTIHLLQEEYVENGPQLVSGTGYDPDIPYGDSIEFIWSSDTGDHIGSGEVVNLSLPAGHHIIVLKVKDGTGRLSVETLGLTILQREEEENQTVPVEHNESGSTRNEAYCLFYLITPAIIIAAILFTIIGIKRYNKNRTQKRSVDGAGPDEVHVADEDLSPLLPP
ncbi:MAG: hypothetical protein KAH57_06795 [Thermoplasmata archaeon]|nr:hypothetical protein [Thermoplasmata archaeon]